MRILRYNKINWFNPRERVLKHSFTKKYLAIYVLGNDFVASLSRSAPCASDKIIIPLLSILVNYLVVIELGCNPVNLKG